MLDYDRRQTGFEDAVRDAVQVPDDYSLLLRTVGVYPIAALPFACVSDGFFDQLRTWHNTPPDQLRQYGTLVIYRAETSRSPGAGRIRQLFRPGNRDLLELPVLSAADREMLVYRFAPIVIQDADGDYDHVGRVEWRPDSTIHIDGEQPAAYFYFTNAFFQGKPVWQINYVFWYSGRFSEN